MSKAGKIFLFSTLTVGLGLTACKQDKHSDILGKWKQRIGGHSEVWIDKQFWFIGNYEDSMTVIFRYEIKNDTMFFYCINDTSMKGKRPVPQAISKDRLIFYNGDCVNCKDTLNRIANEIPAIDSSRQWRTNTLKEMADRQQALTK